MTATNPRDRETVRALLRQHVPSGFPVELGPLTVGDVACRLVSEHQRGADRVFADHLAVARALVTSDVVISDERLTGRRIQELLAGTGVVMPERFWMTFQRAAIPMLLGRHPGPAVVFACERTDAAPTNPRIDSVGELNAEEAAADSFATDMTERERIAFRAGWLARGVWARKQSI